MKRDRTPVLPMMFDTPSSVSLFPDVNVGDESAGMVHRGDPHTSADAAAVIERKRTELHAQVLAAFATHGRLTDEQLEELPEFKAYGPSTIRKRRSELYQGKAIAMVGETTNSRGRKMIVWGLA